MGILQFILCLCMISANLLASTARAATGDVNAKLSIPACPSGSQQVLYPDAKKPLWAACKDQKGLYQGLIIQFTNQQEIIRIAVVKNSLRNGTEIRDGETGILEEKNFLDNHLNQTSYVFKNEQILGRMMPKPMTAADWSSFTSNSGKGSILKAWLKKEPESMVTYDHGRLARVQFENKDYTFHTSKEGRVFADNHKEMKKMFFTDPQALWSLNAADLKNALEPGWGSCKKYAGPIGRLVRYYDHLLYKRQPSESKQLEEWTLLRQRFVNFCIPEDIYQHLGSQECPPQLPAPRPAKLCLVPMGDRLKIPYEPKYFKYEFTLGRTPEEFLSILLQHKFLEFLSDYHTDIDILTLSPEIKVQVKKTARGVLFKPVTKDLPAADGVIDKNWWLWWEVPGYGS